MGKLRLQDFTGLWNNYRADLNQLNTKSRKWHAQRWRKEIKPECKFERSVAWEGGYTGPMERYRQGKKITGMNWVQEQSGGRGGGGVGMKRERGNEWGPLMKEWRERMEVSRGRNVRERAVGRWDQTLFTHGDSSERPRYGGGGWTEGAGMPLSDPLTKGRVGLWCCWHSNVSVNVAAFSLNVVTYTPQDTVAHSEVSFLFQCLCKGDLRGDMEVPLSLLSWL